MPGATALKVTLETAAPLTVRLASTPVAPAFRASAVGVALVWVV